MGGDAADIVVDLDKCSVNFFFLSMSFLLESLAFGAFVFPGCASTEQPLGESQRGTSRGFVEMDQR